MTDVGEHTDYVAKPEYITSTEPLDSTTNQVVNLMPPSAPPAIKVNLEERVPVMGRLQALVPTHFTDIDKLEEGIPEDVLFHPYFDCQGGLRSIGQKFPDYFQVVENTIRRRPAHLAPMALGDLTLQQSPLPDVAELVRKEVCDSDIPHWVSVTYLYEQLTPAQKREIKTHFKSFSSFLRAHGSELAMSIDLLQVSMWARNPTAGSVTTPIEKGGVAAPLYTPVQVLNELFDRFPRNKSLSLKDALELLPKEMVLCLPRNVAGWLSAQKRYFIVDHLDEKENLEKVTVRRRSDTQPLDLVFLLYRALAAKDTTHVAVTALDELLDPAAKTTISRLGVEELASVAPEWLTIGEEEGTPHLYALRSLEALEERILSEKEESKQDNENRQRKKEYLDKKERQFMTKPPPKFEGGV
ncbi:hypothetical protein AGDE_09370 [Angomonas deanei]|uniref:Uncharacterized protein n=1 Tax=Angomonas deanei TaxID=59799 RepID=A0A7G2CJ24_9TRYP|nr:hypothetical protein AGDE_09370 [Angomonas deanei]CAD2218262.1 hypothetical protein, conserved [Angomonas deanei]|eukprot:EPY30584.1 hypothetical protein AGDE_09370 [Angomonas deanei]